MKLVDIWAKKVEIQSYCAFTKPPINSDISKICLMKMEQPITFAEFMLHVTEIETE